jgi:hypothetical protein
LLAQTPRPKTIDQNAQAVLRRLFVVHPLQSDPSWPRPGTWNTSAGRMFICCRRHA